MSELPPRFSSAFNRIVRRHRLARDLSQEALSERADVDRTYVGLLERGQRGAGLDVAKRLADALGIPLTELVAEAEAEWFRSQSVLSSANRSPAADLKTAPSAAKRTRRRTRPAR